MPYYFDEFFTSGKEESISPFLTPSSKKWAKGLPLKVAGLSAFLLAFSFGISFYTFDLSRLLLVFVYFFAGIPALIDTFDDLFKLEINIDVLMTLAAFLAILIGSEMEGALLLVLFAFSGALEETVSEKAKGAIQSLGKISPTMAKVITPDGKMIERSVREIPKGTHLLIKAGEIIPLDGKVLEGSSSIDLSHLTGESAPIFRKIGDEVQAGALNLEGTLTIEVTHISSDSTIARIIHLISQAHEAKPKLQRIFDRFGKMYSSTIILLAFGFTFILPLILKIPFLGIEGSIYRALTFLIAASPCALIIATPTAYLSAISSCAKKGIILKGGFTLDALASCKTFAFDKTGTLTTGRLSCVDVKPFSLNHPDCTLEEAISIAVSLEKGVLHPIGDAIHQLASEKGIPFLPLEEFKSISGFGLEGVVSIGGKKENVHLGHLQYIADKASPKLKEALPDFEKNIPREGKMLSILLFKDTLFVFYFTDELRLNISHLLETFKKSFDVRLLMLTGDHYLNAKYIASKLNIDEFYADLRPEDKLHLVSSLIKDHGLAMIGDGINDAPALARSTIGISMGKIGSRTAIEASDIVFLADDLSLLHWLTKKARKTTKIVRQNLFLALGVITLATTPALLGFIPLWLAVILHEGGTVIVGFNSLRLLKR